MNAASTGEDFLFFSPTNLRKLLHIHGVIETENQREFLLRRYRNLKQLCESAIKDFGKCVPWLTAKIDILVGQGQTAKQSKNGGSMESAICIA